MSLSDSFFGQKFGVTEQDLQSYLSEALSAGGDYADLYFEYLATSSLSIDESIVKSAVQGVSLGVGVRVIAGERTGYAYSDDLSPERIRRAARAYDSRIFQVQASYADSLRQVLVANSEGVLSFDRQPMARLSVGVLAR